MKTTSNETKLEKSGRTSARGAAAAAAACGDVQLYDLTRREYTPFFALNAFCLSSCSRHIRYIQGKENGMRWNLKISRGWLQWLVLCVSDDRLVVNRFTIFVVFYFFSVCTTRTYLQCCAIFLFA